MTLAAATDPAREISASLESHIPGDRRLALAAGTAIPDRVRGSALFADISGFTALTEVLANELGPQRGAEEITANLNRVFHALIAELDRFGGHVIYFSGDAITCWIDGDDGLRATACALAMQQTLSRQSDLVTPGGVRIRIALKVGIAVGDARRFLVGDPLIQRTDVLAGRLIDELAAAEGLANRNEIVLHPSAMTSLEGRVAVGELRSDAQTGRRYGVVAGLVAAVADVPAPPAVGKLPETIVREWLLPAVYERLRTGHSEFLAELRPAFPLFVRFGGIDYDRDNGAIEKLDTFVRNVQRVLTSYGGNLLQLTLGDKGCYLFGVFGSPLAHESDGGRAASAAIELLRLASITAATRLQIGIAYGRLRSGTYGHAQRQSFTCLGDAVNLAARLMSNAPPGEIYVSAAVREAAGDGFLWEELAPITVKGKAEPVDAYALTGSRGDVTHRRVATALPLVGRTQELDVLGARLAEAIGGHGRIVGIAAEAGMGKSRLIAEFIGAARPAGVVVAVGDCQSYGAHTSYFVWREIWSTLFHLDEGRSEEERVRALESELAAIDPALAPRAPLLQGLLHLPIPDNELTAQFDAKLRKTSLEALLVQCLAARATADPLVVVLEDCHWLDPLSRDLLEAIARAAVDLRVLLVLAYRPGSDVGGGLGIENLPHFEEIALAELDPHQAARLVRSKLDQMLDANGAPAPDLVDLVTQRAQGNPFYIEELLNYIRSRGVNPRDGAALRKLELPESLHSLILSRIDTLSEAPRRTLKVASVLGRAFRAAMLPGVYPELGDLDEVRGHLATLGTLDLVSVDQEVEQSYAFKHVVTQEVAYGSMPFAFRSMLHERVGAYIETAESGAIARNVGLLAHHYWHSENLPKKREYLGRAGDAAQASYANAAAIDYFERLTPLVEGSARVDVLLKLCKVLEIVGDWQRAEKTSVEALALAEELGDRRARASCETALAEVARKQGRFDDAQAFLDRAKHRFEAAGDEMGVGKVLHLVGTIAAQHGDYPKAVENYEASLRIREKLGDKGSMGSLLSNLGVIAEFRGDYDGAQAFHERALALRTEVGDRWAISVSMNNLGMMAVLNKQFQEARDWFEKSMRLNRELGDPWLVAICNNNLGNATRGLGDYEAARRHYADSLRAYGQYGDRWALAFLFEDVAMLAASTGNAAGALELMGAADAFRESIGAPRAPSRATELDAQLARFIEDVPDGERLFNRERGRTLDIAAAVDLALLLCESVRAH